MIIGPSAYWDPHHSRKKAHILQTGIWRKACEPVRRRRTIWFPNSVCDISGARELSRAQKLAQIRAAHKFHEQEVESACLAEVVNSDDVRVVQRRERLRLTRKSLGERGVPD